MYKTNIFLKKNFYFSSNLYLPSWIAIVIFCRAYVGYYLSMFFCIIILSHSIQSMDIIKNIFVILYSSSMHIKVIRSTLKSNYKNICQYLLGIKDKNSMKKINK